MQMDLLLWKEKKRYISPIKKLRVEKAIRGGKYEDDPSKKVFSILNADKNALKDAKGEIAKCVDTAKEVTKETKDLFGGILDGSPDSPEKTYYQAVSEIAAHIVWNNDLTIRDVANAAFNGLYDDGQQSSINALSMYTYDHNLNDTVSRLNAKIVNAKTKAIDTSTAIVEKALEDVGANSIISARYLVSRQLGEAEHIANNIAGIYDATYGGMYLDQASYASSFKAEHRAAIQKAKQIASNFKGARDASPMLKNSWMLLTEAIENLGLDNEKADKLSKAEWAKINDEVARLKSGQRRE